MIFVAFDIFIDLNTCIAGMAILMFVGCSLDGFVGLNDVKVNPELYVHFSF